jgi:hypothetical protein
VVGTVIFIIVQGRTRGWTVHDRVSTLCALRPPDHHVPRANHRSQYFQLKKWSASQREQWLKEHTGAYSGFGTVATLLELVPFANILFSFTNTVGAALWAADLEKKENAMTSGTAPGLRETAKKAE